MDILNGLRALVVVAVIAGGLSTSAATAQERPPNILFIVSDDQGYHDLGLFDDASVKTPRLDQLTREGTRLTSFYTTSSICTPSRGSMLTGRYPQRNGTYALFRNKAADFDYEYDSTAYSTSPERVLGMDTREVLISEVLGEAGYTNGVVGKWDLGQLRRYLPLQRGFDFFYGFVNTGIDYYTHERYGIHAMYRGNQPTKEDQGTYATYLFRREAMRFIRQNQDNPFFLYLSFNAPHLSSNLDREDVPVPAPDKYVRQYPDQDPESTYTQYRGAVTAMDEAIGQVLDQLDELGIAENTLVVFMSDHGGSGISNNGPLRGKKSDFFEGGLRSPCIIRWPGHVPADTVSDAFLSSLELFPTFADVAGTQPPDDVVLDGYNMLPVLTEGAPSPREEMFWALRGMEAARVGHWKWVQSEEGSGLFNLAEDLGEQNDLSDERPGVLARIKAQFAEWQAEMAAAEPRGPFRNF